METFDKYNRYAVRIPKGVGVGGGGGWKPKFQRPGGGGGLPNSDPFGQTEKGGGGGVQKLDIFHGCHKCMVSYWLTI